MLRSLFLQLSRSPWLERHFSRSALARRAVRRFMPGETLEEALQAARQLPCGAVFTLLGEQVTSAAEAQVAAREYRRLLEALEAEAMAGQLSVKLTHLGLEVEEGLCRKLLEGLVPEGGETTLWVDMEESRYVDRTLALVEDLHGGGAPMGVCLQAYLHRTPRDLDRLLAQGIPVRLVKGAYREPPQVALVGREAVRRAYLELGRRLLEAPPARGAHVLGTHDGRILRELLAGKAWPGVEVHMLYGIALREQERILRSPIPLRVLVAFGPRWFPWYMRRLAERPANALLALRSLLP